MLIRRRHVLMFVVASLAFAVGCTAAPAVTPTPTPTPTARVTPTPTPTPIPTVTTASLVPSTVTARVGDKVTLQVNVTPAGKGVSAGQIDLRFDPAVISVVSVQAGELLGAGPLEGLKQIDSAKGVLRYALARVGSTTAPTAPGAFARVTFLVVEGAKAGTFALELEKVVLADEAFKDIVPVSTLSGKITVTR